MSSIFMYIGYILHCQAPIERVFWLYSKNELLELDKDNIVCFICNVNEIWYLQLMKQCIKCIKGNCFLKNSNKKWHFYKVKERLWTMTYFPLSDADKNLSMFFIFSREATQGLLLSINWLSSSINFHHQLTFIINRL